MPSERPGKNRNLIPPITRFSDCLFITGRRGDSYEKEAVYIAYGVTMRNTRELLALAVNPTESTTTWREIFTSLKKRGIENVSLVIADGITGMEDVVMEAWKWTKLHFEIQALPHA